jgi:NAD(P)-dependent dehydrogenase (short-subunit alcohol dehydrogenase family)
MSSPRVYESQVAIVTATATATADGGRRVTASALDGFGTVDLVVSNAGFLRPSSSGSMTDRDLHDVIGVHLLGAFNVSGLLGLGHTLALEGAPPRDQGQLRLSLRRL